MGRKCCASGCKTGYDSQRGKSVDQLITMHRYPIKDTELCEKWVLASRGGNDFKPTRSSGLCSLHFVESDFVEYSQDKNSSRTKHKEEKRALRHRYLKKDAVPSVFNMYVSAYVSRKPRPPTKTTSKNRLEEDRSQVVTLEPSFVVYDDVSHSSLSEIHDEIINETATPTGSQIAIHKDQKYDIPLITTESVNQFMNITETLVKFREKGFLCDTLLVAKCGSEVKAHSVLLAAVSPVFLMAIEEKPSSGTYHLCFPEVDLDVLDIAVHFVYTGKLLLPAVYSQRDLLSKLFDKLSDLGLGIQQLHECEKTFVRSAKQPPNSMTLSISVKVEDTDSITNVKNTVQELQASCEWPVDNKPSSAEGFNEAIIVDMAPNDAGTFQTKGDLVESSPSTLAKKKGQRICEQGQLKRKPRKTSNKNGKKERMPANALVPTGTGVRRPVMRPAPNPKTQGDILNLVEPSPSPETLRPNNVEQLADKASSVGAFNEDMAPYDAGKSLMRTISVESTPNSFMKQEKQGNREQERPKRKHRKAGTKIVSKERMPSSELIFQRPAFSILRSLLGDLNASAAASVTGSQELNNLWASLLLDQNADKMNTLDSESYGVHEAIANDNGEPNLKTVDILNLVEPSLTEKTLQSNDADKIADKTSVSSEALTCEHCKEPNAETFRTEIELLWHKIKHHYGQLNVCCFCGRTSSSKENLRIHIKRHLGINARKNHKCNDCGLHFATPRSLKDHRVRHTGEKPHECPDCKKRFSHRENMKRHHLLHSGYNPYLCNFCGKGFTRKTTLMEHVALKHEFVCALCDCKQTSKANMEKHALEVHQLSELVKFNSIIKNPRPYLCDLCGKGFISAFALRFHIKQHSKKPLLFETHGNGFPEFHGLRTAEPPFVCDVCQRSFSQKSMLMIHLTMHSGIKPFACVVCSKPFSTNGHLKQHMKEHTMTLRDNKIFTCSICNKQFTYKAQLSEHFRVHTGERPFKCKICSKQFACKGTLTAHIRTHTGDKPYSCTECEMSFRQSQHLGRHMRTHTGERPFVCEICSKSYKNKIDLRYHLMRFHKIDATSKLPLNSIDINEKVKVPDASDSSDCIVDELGHEPDN